MGLDGEGLLGNHSNAQYRDALLALLPQGKLWQDEKDKKQDSNSQICGTSSSYWVKYPFWKVEKIELSRPMAQSYRVLHQAVFSYWIILYYAV